jgi:hypothetical protein
VAMSFHVLMRCFVSELKARADKTPKGPTIFGCTHICAKIVVVTLLAQTCEVDEGGVHVAASHNRALGVPEVHLQQAAGRMPRIINTGRGGCFHAAVIRMAT